MSIEAKTPPHSVEAERSLLGALLLDSESFEHISDIIRPDSFYHKSHQLVFESIVALAKQDKPYDVLMVKSSLEKKRVLDKVGGDVYLYELANDCASSAHIKSYAELVADCAALRSLIKVSSEFIESAYKPGDRSARDLLDESEQKLSRLAQNDTRNDGPYRMEHLVPVVASKLEKLSESKGGITGMPSGFNDLDDMTSGLQTSDLIIVAGRPSMGKTVFGVNIAESVALVAKKPVVIFSLEMPAESIVIRLLSSLCRINQTDLRTGNLDETQWSKVSSALGMLSESSLYIDDTPGITPMQLRAKLRKIARTEGQLGLVVVDYLQLMRVPELRDNRTLEISDISRMLKITAKEFSVPVIALSQLNRSLEQRQDKRPIMSDLRESGAIEQDADLIAFIYRDEVYNEATEHRGLAEIIIAKHRNGPIGKIVLTFLGKFTRFENHAKDSEVLSLIEME
ncbi:replicative DNA helicase [Candidatus Comchoanobacter bicostacola]|uniref:Replicative DNA helicase n=1 Tax=Candidatus Comchoanobacter bicostacola TaxID=2919598 RepID=A0ABY5DKN3_9GAMM|nr:replicative DNA helicase [Candidatus Comchoanobacter bicostacola]UTC24816.1 replicative DNA helicase [Candidatus Comchoanobacter bicostacola]